MKYDEEAAALISRNEQISVMINEEDHIRIQLYYPGLQLRKALDEAFAFDDWLEEKVTYAFDESMGYLTCCPTNVGTGSAFGYDASTGTCHNKTNSSNYARY